MEHKANVQVSKQGSDRYAHSRFAVDAAAALAAATIVSPIMTVIDKGVIEAAAGHGSLSQSMRRSVSTILRRPSQIFLKYTFGTMMLLYTGTYLTANVVDTFSANADDTTAEPVTASWTKFAVVSGVNMTLSVYKDGVFARTFGSGPMRPLAIGTYAPFVVRDGITILASFNLPATIAPSLPQSFEAFASRLMIAQILAPAGSQLFATPLHLLGLDMYNRPKGICWSDRLRFVRRAWMSSSAARMCRVIPAYGVGGVVNISTRTKALQLLESHRAEAS